ncbi:MAG TPA: hypothetical protein VN256_11350 [Pyrinomonadaceae bacterium]|nr:hypothetical protein [Pyrinomonadaceae bacterium]
MDAMEKQAGGPVLSGDEELHRLILNWIGWKVLLPLLLLILVWPMYGLVLRLEHPFVRAFAHGDLLIFSSLILLEAAIEGENAPHQGFWALCSRMVAKISAILLIAVYVAIKYSAILNEQSLQDSIVKVKDDPSAVTALHNLTMNGMLPYSYFSCAVAVVSVIFSIFAFWNNLHLQQMMTYKRLAQETS